MRPVYRPTITWEPSANSPWTAEAHAFRFWSRVVPSDTGCWEWAGPKDRRGYGLFPYHRTYYRAHRFMHLLVTGNIPDGAFACHRCDNPGCVNPAHLFIGTAMDNAIDREQKGRGRRLVGIEHPRAKFSAETIGAVRRTYIPWRHGYVKTGRLFGMSAGNVQRIIEGRIWRESCTEVVTKRTP